MADYDFTATARINNGVVEWELCRTDLDTDRCGKTKDTYPTVVVPEGKNNAKFEFVINDQTGKGIKFANDPIWVQLDSQPTGPILDAQIPKDSIKGMGTTTLEFKDKNDNDNGLVLKYQLNFTDAQGIEVTSIDPDIINGGKGFYGGEWVTYGLAGAVAGALLALMFARFALRWRSVKR